MTWITGGRVVDPLKEKTEELDVVIQNGKIARILPTGQVSPPLFEKERIDASGFLIMPGLIDMHVHLREPGQEHKETIATGARAAVCGGFVGVACMANTSPVNDHGSVSQFIIRKARAAQLARVFPIAAITKGLKGGVLTDFKELQESGAVAVSDDGRPVADRNLMRKAMQLGYEQGLAVISHCENITLSKGGWMHEGEVSARLRYKGIPAEAEEEMIRREISICRETGFPVHIAHVSTAGSVRLIREAKEDKVPVTAETAPHYFTLDHSAVRKYGTDAKMNPPLRTPEDVQAIRKGLSEDIIDVIATDHAPHAPWEKEVDFSLAPFGIIGLETALPLALDLVREGFLTLPQMVRKLSYIPAKLLGIKGGRLLEGGEADLIIVDSERKYILSKEDLQSKSRNCPFLGRPLQGINLLTIVGGRVVWKR